jgi:hypothetical protein
MGFFSKTCAKTHLPVVHITRGFPELAEIAVLFPNGRKLEGFYDGYGRLQVEVTDGDGYQTEAEEDLYTDEKTWEGLKFVLLSAYEGETYDQLGPSHDEHAQGHFMDDAFLHHCLEVKKFPSFKDYERAFKKLANW